MEDKPKRMTRARRELPRLVTLADWTGTHEVLLIDLTAHAAEIMLEDGETVTLTRARFATALRRGVLAS